MEAFYRCIKEYSPKSEKKVRWYKVSYDSSKENIRE
jgi:hypothetical protein